jgi:hypothetical protein
LRTAEATAEEGGVKEALEGRAEAAEVVAALVELGVAGAGWEELVDRAAWVAAMATAGAGRAGGGSP